MSKPRSDNTVPTMVLDAAQRNRLQQQMQQKELGTFAQSSVVLHQQFNPKFQTTFQPCNLKGAIQLIEDFHSHVIIDLSPQKNVQKSGEGQSPEYATSEFPCLPKQVAWILATSKVFMYPELLPIRSLKVKHPRDKIFFTKAEDNLLALGLKHFEGTEFPKPLISKYLLTAKSAHQLTVRIKNLNISRAPDNIIKYYKKTKQLPILFKCCEELRPDQWKPPVEREERHLPFWLKASLPAIQEEIQHLTNHAGESGNRSGSAEMGSDPGLESVNDVQYPLLLPKGVVLTLKPLAKRFSSRRIWRQRSSVLKPLLIRPTPSLQPCSNDSTQDRLAQSEAPPQKVDNSNSQMIQPVTGLQTAPEASPLGVSGSDGIKIPKTLPAVAPKNTARSHAFLSPPPVAFQSKVLLPSVVTPNRCEPGMKPPKKKWAKASRLLKPAPVLPSPRIILTLPATPMKVVTLNNSFNVIPPLRAIAPSPQTIPITTLLVSPTSFICPLNQPLIASISPLIVSGNPVNLPVPPTPEENTQMKPSIHCPQAEGESAFPVIQPKLEPQESSPLCPSPYPKEEHSPGPPTTGRESQAHSFAGNAHSWTVVKTMDGRQVLEPLSHTTQKDIDFLPGNLLKIVKVEPEEPEEEATLTWNRFPETDVCDEIKKEAFMELDMGPPYQEASSAPEVKTEDEEGETAMTFSSLQVTQGEANPAGKMSKGSPMNMPSSTHPDIILSSPLGKPEDSSHVVGQSVRTQAGPETGGKDRLKEEEEKEEELEDLDQDEEMASVSEEVGPFVSEPQETVEKPTCLVSGKCMGQENDFEEENPWKENSGPEVVVKVEKMQSLEKDDEVMDEVDRHHSSHPCFT
ncbi:YY1-associated protein 1 isoform X2 [Dromiciops gliroides]|uniref:YY1-associated protein 1 isoform X2 n=1 Tax=Dromiciops gliroides TaxID=33562 RepID=UPI001CC7E276|nr:YY1-associated protein 1 isoform X2 [Dromiciops gliroides]